MSSCISSSNPQQRPLSHFGSCHCPQQALGTQGQVSKGEEGKTKKNPTKRPASVAVAKK